MKNSLLVIVAILFITVKGRAQTEKVLTGTFDTPQVLSIEFSPYLIVDSVIFNKKVEIEPGVLIKFKFHPTRKAYITFSDEVYAAGSPTEPITFTSDRDNNNYLTIPRPGDWGYICIDHQSTGYSESHFEHIIVKYGGGKTYHSKYDKAYSPMICMIDKTPDIKSFNISNSIIERSANEGILGAHLYLSNTTIDNCKTGLILNTSDGNVTGCTFSNNTDTPITLSNLSVNNHLSDFPNIINLDNNTFKSNGISAIAIDGHIQIGDSQFNKDVQLLNDTIPFLITNDLLVKGLNLSIEAGNIIKFLPSSIAGRPLSINLQDAALISTGTSDNPIVFTSMYDYSWEVKRPVKINNKPMPGDWGYISGDSLFFKYTYFLNGGKYVNKNNEIIRDSSAVLHYRRAINSINDIFAENCIFNKLYAHGILAYDQAFLDDRLIFQYNHFLLKQNQYGIISPNNSEPPAIINADYNYWNSKNGPIHESNINGNGCKVDDDISFSNHLEKSDAQSNLVSSIVKGYITGSDNETLARAIIKLKSSKTKTIYSKKDGDFTIPFVKPGKGYHLEIKAKGYYDTLLVDVNIPEDACVDLGNIVLKEREINYVFDKVTFNLNQPQKTYVGVGGTAHRYYKVIDKKSHDPMYGVEVIIPGLDTMYTDSKGIVDIKIPATSIGTREYSISQLGAESKEFPLDQRVTFSVEVLPYEYQKTWSGSTFMKIGISYLLVQQELGAQMALNMKNNGYQEFADSIILSRQSKTTVGLEFGAEAKIEAGPFEAGAEATAGINASTLFQDDFQFDYKNNTGEEALAKFMVMANGSLPYMDAPLMRLFVACIERQFDEIDEAALSNGFGFNIHAQASAKASLECDLVDGSEETPLGVGLEGSAGGVGDINFMTTVYAQKSPGAIFYPTDIDLSFSNEFELGVEAKAGFDLKKLFENDDENKKKDNYKNKNDDDDDDPFEIENDIIPIPIDIDDLEIDLASLGAAGGFKYGVHFGTSRFGQNPSCRIGFMYGYKYDLKASNILIGEAGINQEREFQYTFTIEDQMTIDTFNDKVGLANSMLNSPTDNIKLNLSDLTSGKIFNDPFNTVAFNHARSALDFPPVPYEKTVTDKVDDGSFNVEIAFGLDLIKAKFGAGFKYSEFNQYPIEKGVFYNWQLLPTETYSFVDNNEAYKAEAIIQDIVEGSCDYLWTEVQNGLPKVFNFFNLFSWLKATNGEMSFNIENRPLSKLLIEGEKLALSDDLDHFKLAYWDWYGTGETTKSSLKAVSPAKLKRIELIKKIASNIYKFDYGIGGFYQFEPYNTSVGDNDVTLVINYHDEELKIDSTRQINEVDLRMYKEDKENNRWMYIGGMVDADNNTVSAKIDAFGTFTLAPFIPHGQFNLVIDPDTIDLDKHTTASITSSLLSYNTDEPVADGEQFFIQVSRGLLNAASPDTSIIVAASAGKVKATYLPPASSGEIIIKARSLYGDATAIAKVFIIDSNPPEQPNLLSAQMIDENVILKWNNLLDEDILSYKVHYDTISGAPYKGHASVFGEPSPIDVHLDTTTIIKGLTPSKEYFFSITAEDRCGNESTFSNELSVLTEVNHAPVFYHKKIFIQPNLDKGTVIDTLWAEDKDKGQELTFYLTDYNNEDAFKLNSATGELIVEKAEKLNYLETKIDTFHLKVGVRDNANISAQDEGQVMVIIDSGTSIWDNNDKQKGKLEIYPNPAKDELSINLKTNTIKSPFKVNFYTFDGKLLSSQTYDHSLNSVLTINVEFLPLGLYLIELTDNTQNYSAKLRITHN
ncbi:T9SS type A sorting domain-containing protein [Carboxylicivirga sp. M1479]|uniref:T9SS type A sorting domain-containing protein n=1 Tax=Carboxylicivirga sp. M1479 TaxID=2594476 RepID=UPI001177FB69|nr:T9SS type A sorting domain-containing protein [Carboxylicivirga sp. M1479]TRX62996.1 T9SS type A sorting domain-containing protein [Carboxylicivirga sp. M1479]